MSSGPAMASARAESSTRPRFHPDRRMYMDEVEDIDELGPVDWIVVEFPGSRFNGEIAPALLDLVERDLVRVLDLLC